MTFFGLMHGEAVGIGQTPLVAISYLAVGLVLAGCAIFSTAKAQTPVGIEEEEPVGQVPAP